METLSLEAHQVEAIPCNLNGIAGELFNTNWCIFNEDSSCEIQVHRRDRFWLRSVRPLSADRHRRNGQSHGVNAEPRDLSINPNYPSFGFCHQILLEPMDRYPRGKSWSLWLHRRAWRFCGFQTVVKPSDVH